MPESWKSVLKNAESSVELDEAFVERLSSELSAVVETTPAPKRSKTPLFAGAAAALALVLGVVGVLFSVSGSGTLDDLPAVSEVDPSLPVASADAAMPLSIARACDSFLVAVAQILRPGSGQQVVTAASTAGPNTSAAAIYDLRDQLSQISDLYELHGERSPLTNYGFNEAISELSEAALFVQLGEFVQAEQHLATTRALIGDLADEPGLSGCLEL